MEFKPANAKKFVQSKAKDTWRTLTETKLNLDLKLTVTPIEIIAVAAGIGVTVCVVRCVHKMEMKRALRKQAKELRAEAEQQLAEVLLAAEQTDAE